MITFNKSAAVVGQVACITHGNTIELRKTNEVGAETSSLIEDDPVGNSSVD